MPNNYFSFKQFTVQQDKCAMKVCTDACVFGAWVANSINDPLKQPENILDIGAGTGLLSLMIAQKTTGTIDAIEINEDAAEQARANFLASPWSSRLLLIYGPVQQLAITKQYDLILSNPPFFEDDLRSPEASKNAAKHDTDLTLGQLAELIATLLSTDGSAYILLPFARTAAFEKMIIAKGWFIFDRLSVKQSTRHHFFRSIIGVSKKERPVQTTEIAIHDDHRNYTAEFTDLLKDYYLKL